MFKVGSLITPIPTEQSGWYKHGLVIAEIIQLNDNNNWLGQPTANIVVVVQSNNTYKDEIYEVDLKRFTILNDI